MAEVFGDDNRPRTSFSDKDYGYDYPDGLDLNPNSEQHRKVMQRLLGFVDSSYRVMRQQYPKWEEIDQTLNLSISLSDWEQKLKDADGRRPVSIVVPVSYAIEQTLLTYLTNVFLSESPLFKYEGVEPGDTIGAALLEKVVELHNIQAKNKLKVWVAFRDALRYGLGPIGIGWETKYRTITQDEPITAPDPVTGILTQTGLQETVNRVVDFEGNVLTNISPKAYFPDPSVASHQVQDGQFVAWVEQTNRVTLLEREQSAPEDWFNAKYLQHLGDGRSMFVEATDEGDNTIQTDDDADVSTHSEPIDLIHLHVKFVPKDWGLGDSEYPESWLFTIAGEQLIMSARPLNLDHAQYPIAVFSPEFDGYSAIPLSRMMVTEGIQKIINWLVNAHVADQRQNIVRKYVVDQTMIHAKDMENPETNFVRIYRHAMGRKLSDMIMPLPMTPVTLTNMGDVAALMGMAHEMSGASDSLRGTPVRRSERVSATESRDTRSSAQSRLQMMAQLMSMQGMQDLANMCAINTQQFQSDAVFVAATGRWERELTETYGARSGTRVAADPRDMRVNFDVVPHSATEPDAENPQELVQLFQMAAQNPVLSQRLDQVRLFKLLAQQLGMKNISDFEIEVTSDEEARQQIAAGNAAAIEQIPGGL